MKYLLLPFSVLLVISCGNTKQHIEQQIGAYKDSVAKYARMHAEIVDQPYPSDPVELTKRKTELQWLELKRGIFVEKIDSLNEEINK